MSDSDDDMPPPLEDMSETLQVQKEMKKKAEGVPIKSEDHAEEVRLAPKKVSKIPANDNFDFDKKATKPSEKPKEKKNAGLFGGMQAGFLNSKPAKKKPVVEDHTNIKASKDKADNLKLKEVQEAMTNTLEKNKNDWLTPEFMLKLQQNPRLLAAFTDPQCMQVMQEMGKNPQEAMQKYGNNAQFKEIMMEFSAFMGDHFEGVAEKKKREDEEAAKKAEEERKRQEEEMKKDPVYNTIQTDPLVKEFLADPEVMEILNHLRFKGGLDLHEVMRDKPQVGQKMMYLIQKGVLNTQTAL